MPQPDEPRHNLRLTRDLKKKLLHSAVDNGRSMNAEILARLETSFSPSPLREIENLLKQIAPLEERDRSEVLSLLSRASALLAKS